MLFYVLCLVFICGSEAIYTQDFSLLALKRAYASYCPSDNIVSWNCYWCDAASRPVTTDGISTINVTDTNTFAYVFTENQVIWVVIRGTQVSSITNWVYNVDFLLTPLFDKNTTIQVHEGFKTDTNTLYPGILTAVRERLSKCASCSILLAGHSLGGSIASIVALRLREDIGSISIAEWSYGSPRTGNPAFAQSHTNIVRESWRVVNMLDIVPHIPTHFFDIFRHVPTEVWYQSNYVNFKICDGSGEDPNCSDTVLIPSITDHLTYFNMDLRNGHQYGCI